MQLLERRTFYIDFTQRMKDNTKPWKILMTAMIRGQCNCKDVGRNITFGRL